MAGAPTGSWAVNAGARAVVAEQQDTSGRRALVSVDDELDSLGVHVRVTELRVGQDDGTKLQSLAARRAATDGTTW